MRGVGRGKIFPIFFISEGLGMWEGGKYSPFFHQGRMRDVGRGKYSPFFSSGKDEGCGDGCEIWKNVPLFIREG